MDELVGCYLGLMKLKSIRLFALAAVLALLPSTSALAATPVAGTETYLFHSYIVNGTNSASDSAAMKFMGLEASFNYDISALAAGTELQFTLDATSTKTLTVGTGCCVQGGVDGTWEQQNVSTGGGVWRHTKAEGEKVANLKIYNRYDEFLDGKYKSLLGKITALTTVKIGEAAPVEVTKSNSTGYKLTFEFASYSKTFTVPKQMTKLWVETMWKPKSAIAKGTELRFTDPKISIYDSKTKKSRAFTFKNHGFSFSFAAYNDSNSYYQEAEGATLKVTQANATVYAGQGINLPSSTPVGSKITISPFKITKQ
jgi:hypothetical protein